ncbi:MAG TPA: tRNA preQ1(34) S-adenosylmethionine ribosyltransferase-isomerase QueA [Rhodobacteraceae bacterium]|jgi:S-adenosylmethionine:tRNA ribosyltransferase-isomerase|nr:tRNA preQ1(34) S-adenosylmethionine ribosyltransferase-isomerase QueA [Paracoccaceae bacterium]
MKLSDFDFELPEDLIATRPARPRTSARLLVADGALTRDLSVVDLPAVLRKGDRLVLNDTKVIPARLFGLRHRDSAQGPVAAKIEVTLLEPRSSGDWMALLKPLKKLKIGEEVVFSDGFCARLIDKLEGTAILRFNLTGDDFDAALTAAGAMPLPPYIAAKRPADEKDKEDYQTVFARHKGAVAAPTASLHFDDELLAKIAAIGVDFSHVTLHVGAGTFLPVKVDDVSQHKMHSEWGRVSQQAADEINRTRQNGGRIIPVGTTALRLIESAAVDGCLQAWQGSTDIFIRPGYEFEITDALMTNFHLPKSTLMMLVSALMGTKRVREIYNHAIENRYRFFSYGDASILFPIAKKRR